LISLARTWELRIRSQRRSEQDESSANRAALELNAKNFFTSASGHLFKRDRILIMVTSMNGGKFS
jgi:hypothetical protein